MLQIQCRPPVPPEGMKEFRMLSNYPLTRSAVRRTTLSPDGGEGVESRVTFPSPQQGEGLGVRGNSQLFAGFNFFTASLRSRGISSALVYRCKAVIHDIH